MIQISEERYQQLINAENTLKDLGNRKPRLTPVSKKYKEALQKLVNKVEEVGTHPSFIGMFQIAYAHGFKYDGPSFHLELTEAKKVLK